MAFDKSQVECLIDRFGTDIRINNKTVKVIFEQDIIFFDENTQTTVQYFTAKSGSGVAVGSTFFYGDTYRITRIEDDLSGIANYYYKAIEDGNNGI
ncbi:hypothetical protein NMD63_05645 [Edwardsiella tarda]|uniref:hypothetical protein n=1 Tax=Edwardsiella tarda TaxID=636 RepID=UPI00351C3F08